MQRREEKNRLRMKSNWRRIVDLIAIRISASAVSQAFKCMHIIANGNCLNSRFIERQSLKWWPFQYSFCAFLSLPLFIFDINFKPDKLYTGIILAFVCIEANRMAEKEKKMNSEMNRDSSYVHITNVATQMAFKLQLTKTSPPPPALFHFLSFLFPYCFDSDTHLI